MIPFFSHYLRHPIIISIAVCFTLSIPSLFFGFAFDDHLLMASLKQNPVIAQRDPWDLFNMVSTMEDIHNGREKGTLGWWTHPTYRFRLFRPLASLLHAVEFTLWPHHAVLMHAVNILAYVALVALVALLYKRFSTTRLAWSVALFLFAIDDTHAYAIGWIANRNIILCLIPGMGSVWAYDQWRRSNWRIGSILSPFLFALALLTYEAGLAVLAYLFAYSLCLDREKSKKRFLALLPHGIIAIGYVAAYWHGGFGAFGSGMYHSIFAEFMHAVATMVHSVSLLIFSQLSSIPQLSFLLYQIGGGWIIACGGVVFIGVALQKILRHNPRAMFFAIGMILSSIPMALTFPQDRLLMPLGFGAAGLFGELTMSLKNRVAMKSASRIVSSVLVHLNLYASLLFFIPALGTIALLEEVSRSIEKKIGDADTILINVPNDIFMINPALIRYEQKGQWPHHVYPLYAGMEPILVRRLDDYSIEIESHNGWLASPMQTLVRSTIVPFSAGERIQLDAMVVEVMECSSDGRPVRVQCTFASGLKSFRWMRWDGLTVVDYDINDCSDAKQLDTRFF
ncbi:MAG: hypothetical protein JW795_03835 [Chitinivibrionales bacterium]|nr:hypothetical protein [Chitinivibrionales bacterium]